MARAKSFSAEALEALGTKRLAGLLFELGDNDAVIKRRLRLELAGQQGPEQAAREISKRLSALARARSFVEWHEARALAADLDAQREAILRQVAPQAPVEALDLMWRFLQLAGSVFNRCDDSNGTIGAVFHTAIVDLGAIAAVAKPARDKLASDVFAVLQGDDYGHRDGLIASMAPALGKTGLELLKGQVAAYGKEKIARPADKDRKVVGWSSGQGRIYEDDLEQSRRDRLARYALMEIADALGDVDGFMAQYDAKTRKVPKIAAEIARRMQEAGRIEDALKILDAAEHRKGGWDWPDFEWEDTRIAVLDALGRKDDAQAQRWSCFERSLSTQHLRDYISRLPDFDDVEAERRAMEHAERFKMGHQALAFLIDWPDLERAARLVLVRAQEFDGDTYEVLTPAADALSARYPLAATVLLRAMIDFALTKARVKRYKHAARHLMECTRLSAGIADFGQLEAHATFVARLKKEHGRKAAFWSEVG